MVRQMHIFVPILFVKPMAVASLHGFADIRRPPHELWPYTLVPIIPDADITTAAFLAASTVHFADDIGPAASTTLHIILVVLALLDRPGLAWVVFMLYYCGVHTTRVVHMHTWLRLPISVAAIGALFSTLPATDLLLPIPHTAQAVVIAHVIVNTLHPPTPMPLPSPPQTPLTKRFNFNPLTLSQ